MDDRYYMTRAIELSFKSVESGGGPFGAVVVLGGRIVGEGYNKVVRNSDPTAHAEILAIRAACKAINNFSLQGAVIYSSCEPCPMCLGAIWWARISTIYYANGRADAAWVGFDDQALYDEVATGLLDRKLPLHQLMREEALAAFRLWVDSPGKTPY
jgi:tRNA(Arg) A34 adenosine deaminase TadA